MKVAVIISGEYRTFKYCRHTIPFLDDKRVDVYFSTWNKNVYTCPKIDLIARETVTEEMIINDLGFKPSGMIVEDFESFEEEKYNSKMIHRWTLGFKMIIDSAIKYDYVIITRPDMFYRGGLVDLDSLTDLKDSLGVIWTHSLKEGKLADITMASSFEIMKDIIDSLNVIDWINSNTDNWHIWWHDYCKSKTNVVDIGDNYSECIFYRYIVPNNTTDYPMVMSYEDDWRHLRILHEIDLHGRSTLLEHWSEETIQEAERKWSEGYFDKYRNYGKDNP